MKKLVLFAIVAIASQYAFAQSTAVSPPIAPSATAGPETSVTASQDESWMQGKYGLGGMSGMRTELSDAGVEPFLFYTSIFSGNPVGGARQGETYVDDFYFGANLFLKKLIGWEGAKLTITGVNRDGPGLSVVRPSSFISFSSSSGFGMTKLLSSSAGLALRMTSTVRKSTAFI